MKNTVNKINNTQVLLIGVSRYYDDKNITSIPNVKKNIMLLTEAFLKNEVLSITENSLTISLNKTNTEIERNLIKVSRETDYNDTLIVYYAGHGLMSNQDFNLYLTASNTTTDYLETDGINANRFREIIESSKASTKIIIIDACYSGGIHNYNGTKLFSMNSNSNISGTYIISSSSNEATSLYPVDSPKEPTFFTGEFLNVLIQV